MGDPFLGTIANCNRISLRTELDTRANHFSLAFCLFAKSLVRMTLGPVWGPL